MQTLTSRSGTTERSEPMTFSYVIHDQEPCMFISTQDGNGRFPIPFWMAKEAENAMRRFRRKQKQRKQRRSRSGTKGEKP